MSMEKADVVHRTATPSVRYERTSHEIVFVALASNRYSRRADVVCGSAHVVAGCAKRRIRVELTGEVGDCVIANVTVDGVTSNLKKELPVDFEYNAKDLKADARYLDSRSKNPLSASIKVDDGEVGNVRAGSGQGVKTGYKVPGVLGLGSSETWISAVPAENVETPA